MKTQNNAWNKTVLLMSISMFRMKHCGIAIIIIWNKGDMKMNSRKLFAIGAATFAAFVSYPSFAADSPAIKAAIQVEDAFAEVVEMAKPAVVVITNKQTMRRNGFNNFQMDIPDNFFDFF